MINLDTLDKTKTYAGYQIGTGIISVLIQKLSKKETDLKTNQIATHVFMLHYDNDWQVVESHLKWNGIKRLPYSDWLKDYDPSAVFCFERELDLSAMQYLVDYNPGYSIAQISKDALGELTSKNIWNNSAGVVCSEAGAMCDKDFKICYTYKLPYYLIKPVHWQMLLTKGA